MLLRRGSSRLRAIRRLTLECTGIALDENAVGLLVGALGFPAHSLLHDIHLALIFFFQLGLQALVLDVLELTHRELWLFLGRQLTA